MEKRWYAIRTYVGYEPRVKAALQQTIRERGQDTTFGAIIIPTEQAVDVAYGKKQAGERQLLPGHMLVEMVFNEDTRRLVLSIPHVLGFIGESDARPTPIPARKVQEITRRVEARVAASHLQSRLGVGEKIKVVEGPLCDFTGTVEAVSPERSRVRVVVSVFGRPVPVDLDLVQVEAA